MKPKYIHTAVCKGNGVCVTGHALLLTVIGAGGRSHNMASVDVVRVDCLPTWCMPGKMRGEKRKKKKTKNRTFNLHIKTNQYMNEYLLID